MEWNIYNVHWKLGDRKGKTSMTALTKEDAKITFEKFTASEASEQSKYPFEAKAIKIYGPLGLYKSTPKQKLAQNYHFMLGSVSAVEAMLGRVVWLQTPDAKQMQAKMLVGSQIAKLKRDLRDFFKKAGLNVK